MYGFYWRWNTSGATTMLHDRLRTQVRLARGRNPQPSAAIIDSQSVRAADTVPKASRGYDTAKKVNGRKRHLAVDTAGLVLAIMVTAASVQDRDGARWLLWRLRLGCRGVLLVWADAAYQGRLVAWATSTLRLRVAVVRQRLPTPSRSCPALTPTPAAARAA